MLRIKLVHFYEGVLLCCQRSYILSHIFHISAIPFFQSHIRNRREGMCNASCCSEFLGCSSRELQNPTKEPRENSLKKMWEVKGESEEPNGDKEERRTETPRDGCHYGWELFFFFFFGVIQNECQTMILALFFPFSYLTRPKTRNKEERK